MVRRVVLMSLVLVAALSSAIAAEEKAPYDANLLPFGYTYYYDAFLNGERQGEIAFSFGEPWEKDGIRYVEVAQIDSTGCPTCVGGNTEGDEDLEYKTIVKSTIRLTDFRVEKLAIEEWVGDKPVYITITVDWETYSARIVQEYNGQVVEQTLPWDAQGADEVTVHARVLAWRPEAIDDKLELRVFGFGSAEYVFKQAEQIEISLGVFDSIKLDLSTPYANTTMWINAGPPRFLVRSVSDSNTGTAVLELGRIEPAN